MQVLDYSEEVLDSAVRPLHNVDLDSVGMGMMMEDTGTAMSMGE